MPKCLVSNQDLEPFMSFGPMPLANGFLLPQDFNNEYFYDLQIGFCSESRMLQLTQQVDRERMFHGNYAYYSSISMRMAEHFRTFAGFVTEAYLSSVRDPFVVEIGSNDGIMLQHFARAGYRHLGIEPSQNVAEVAKKRGIQTLSQFFDEKIARQVVSQCGQADVFLGANVMCHIPYIHSVMAGIRLVLKPRGVLIFEDPYLGDILERTSYDQVYDEHAFYFSVHSVEFLVALYGMQVVDVQHHEVHGGSMRYVVAHDGAYRVSDRVLSQKQREKDMGLLNPATYLQFKENVERSRDDLMTLLSNLKRQGKRVTAYGATSKSTTVTNYCGITPDLVSYISDTTPIKQGKFSPGKHIPVLPYETFSSNYPDYALLFAWNHSAEILEKERAFRNQGGKFILYVPRVHVI